MTLPLFFPAITYRPQLRLGHGTPMATLCAVAGVPCRASGVWTKRQIEIVDAPTPFIEAEPTPTGAVRIAPPAALGKDPQRRARYALGALAYALMDGVARQSIRGEPWTKIDGRGRPRSGRAKSNRERQQEYRARLR